jgi:hypothetical protein
LGVEAAGGRHRSHERPTSTPLWVGISGGTRSPAASLVRIGHFGDNLMVTFFFGDRKFILETEKTFFISPKTFLEVSEWFSEAVSITRPLVWENYRGRLLEPP